MQGNKILTILLRHQNLFLARFFDTILKQIHEKIILILLHFSSSFFN